MSGGDEFNYDEGSGKGPSCWGSVKQEWKTCGTGKSQSPIDIPVGSTLISLTLGDLQRTYASGSAVLKNRGHDIAVLWNGNAGKININGTDYEVVQCHWHSPSEHTFGGTRYDLEIHIVHQNAQNQITVISMVFQIGQADPFLSSLLSSIESIGGGEKDLGNVNPVDIGFAGRNYYRYTGSLTTPPCTEGVVWTVLQEVKTASTEQVHALKDALAEEFKENSRPNQSLGARPVLFYDPGESAA
ncbi:alpha carbonic anhydrase 4-like [Durio zibethinus]|uniref:Alpha carbonic anhydrase 4-like n=1 Tax=Durio zibethinus TaxID=66656 RepID=A0A6P6AMF9_DURZI|nr:alpha carbonic anhydrase 4-like [Durio zibethinus]